MTDSKVKFTILGHASMLIEYGGKSLLIDPWLVGSCYWRSWWNFPAADEDLVRNLAPDYVYLTHLHWDHYHAPSLRALKREPKVFLPKATTTRMVTDLEPSSGSNNYQEIRHGETVVLAEGFEITSYQFGPFCIDSALVIKAGNTVLFDANDTKFFGFPLEQIKKNHPEIDFVFRSHSSATAIPYCIDNYQEMFPEQRTKNDYEEEFSNFCLSVGAKYAVPFASNRCFLHRDTIKFNDTGVNPQSAQTAFDRIKKQVGSSAECIVMAPGSSWQSDTGFSIREFDYSKNKERFNRYKGLFDR